MRFTIVPLIVALTVLQSACSAIGNAAQGVADMARGQSQPPAPSTTPPTGQGSVAARNDAPCARNFEADGGFFEGKQFKTSVPLPAMNPDTAYRKAYASLVSRGWQIVQADKEIRMVSASQQVTGSPGGKTVPFNILIKTDARNIPTALFTFKMSSMLLASEDGYKKIFCEIAADIQS